MKFLKLSLGLFAALSLFILPALTLAQSSVGGTFTTGSGITYPAGGGSPYTTGGGANYATGGGCGAGNGSFTLCNPLAVSNFCDLVKALLNIVLAIGIPIAVLFLVWSGFRFILARGSQEGLGKAKENFKWVIIGIAIFLGAWTLATIISATIQTLDKSGTVQFCGR